MTEFGRRKLQIVFQTLLYKIGYRFKLNGKQENSLLQEINKLTNFQHTLEPTITVSTANIHINTTLQL